MHQVNLKVSSMSLLGTRKFTRAIYSQITSLSSSLCATFVNECIVTFLKVMTLTANLGHFSTTFVKKRTRTVTLRNTISPITTI